MEFLWSRSSSLYTRSTPRASQPRVEEDPKMKARVLGTVTASFVAVVLFSTSSSANHSWGGYHWARPDGSFTLKTGDNVDTKWDAYLNSAITDWNDGGTDVQLTKVTGGTRPKNCRPTAGQIEVCNERYGNTGWLGIAQIWISGGTHISQAITKLNDYYFDTPTYNTVAWRSLVSCQEIAHDFGLAHQDENFDNKNLGSCMDYTSDPDGTIKGQLSNEKPNAHDFEEIGIIYNHSDTTTTVGARLPSGIPQAMQDLEADGPGQWGRLVRSSANGRVQTYELDFGNGRKIVTEVFWADPARDGRGR